MKELVVELWIRGNLDEEQAREIVEAFVEIVPNAIDYSYELENAK